MRFFFFCMVLVFSALALWPQDGKNNIISPAPQKQDAGAQAIESKLSSLEQEIAKKVKDIEETRKKLLEYDSNAEKEIYIDHAIQGSKNFGRGNIDTYKFTRLLFEGDALKKIRIVTHKVHKSRPLEFVYKSLFFAPEGLQDAKVRIQNASSTDESLVKDYFPETKLKIYKLIEKSLSNSSLQLKFQVERFEKEKKKEEQRKAEF